MSNLKDFDSSEEGEEEEEDSLFFYMVLVIELNEVAATTNEPFVAYRLPNLWKADPFSKNVASFCFPDTTPFPTEDMESERFSFVLTEDDGDRRFGYCLRKLSQGTGPRMPISFVVLTFIPCEPLYNKILDKIAFHYENSSSQVLTQFLESVIQNDFPKPGETFSVETHDGKKQDSWTLTRPETDLSLEQLPVDHALIALSSINILRIFSSMLIERRVIFCSKKISTLSAIAQVMMALIYPFVWQHIFIPILPETLLSYCCAPMPFVVGVLEAHLPEVLKLPMDEVLIVMIDEDRFLSVPEPDIDSDVKLLPNKHFTELLKNLKNARRCAKRAAGKRSRVMISRAVTAEDVTQSIRTIQNSFLHFFVELLGPAYQLHFSEGKKYSVDAYKECVEPEYRPLLEQFVCAQLFERFIRLNLLSDDNKNSLFARNIRAWLRKATFLPNADAKAKMNYNVSCVSSVDPLGRGRRKTGSSIMPSASMRSQVTRDATPLRKFPMKPITRKRAGTSLDRGPLPKITPELKKSPTVPIRVPADLPTKSKEISEFEIPSEDAPVPPGHSKSSESDITTNLLEDAPNFPGREDNWMASLSKRTQKKRKQTTSADFRFDT